MHGNFRNITTNIKCAYPSCAYPILLLPVPLLCKIVWTPCPICSMRGRARYSTAYQVYGPAHLLDNLSSKWVRARSLHEQIRARIVSAILISLAPRYLKRRSQILVYSMFCRVNGLGPSSQWAIRVNIVYSL